MLSCANVLHCENPLQVENDWIKEYDLKEGNFDITAVDRELAEIIPSALDMGAVYQRLVRDTMSSKEDYVEAIIRVYNDELFFRKRLCHNTHTASRAIPIRLITMPGTSPGSR